jgi:hypothetical protein
MQEVDLATHPKPRLPGELYTVEYTLYTPLAPLALSFLENTEFSCKRIYIDYRRHKELFAFLLPWADSTGIFKGYSTTFG